MTILDSWEHDTRHMRAWLNLGGTPTEPLRFELARWLVEMSDTAAQAVRLLADALDTQESEAP